MSMTLTIYVGPYLECEHGDVDLEKHESILTDGRMEARKSAEKMAVIPNCTLPGIDRQMHFDRYEDDAVVVIENYDIHEETKAFTKVAKPVLDDLLDANAWYRVRWGIVPRWG